MHISTRAFGATPVTPIPLLPIAAIVPDTCVPCPWSSAQPDARVPAPVSALKQLVMTRPVRSGCDASTPVSTTPTVNPGEGGHVA